MKPRQLADVIGFVSYFYAVNHHLPERELVQRAFHESARSWAYLEPASDRRSTKTHREATPAAEVRHNTRAQLTGTRR